MKLYVAFLTAATSLSSALSQNAHDTPNVAPATCNYKESQHFQNVPDLVCRVSSNARWFVDKRHGVISAWSLVDAAPLWSSNGVVYRALGSANSAVKELTQPEAPSVPATEIFGRVYFFLNDVAARRALPSASASVRQDDLLIALDPYAQGRLVWKRRAQDFAPFFPSYDKRALGFVGDVQPLPNDELLVQVAAERETKRFALNAATGEPRLIAPAEIR